MWLMETPFFLLLFLTITRYFKRVDEQQDPRTVKEKDMSMKETWLVGIYVPKSLTCS